MKSLSHSDDGAEAREQCQYESIVRIQSTTVPGVTFDIHRMSFGRRMELSRHIRQISRKVEFCEAGSQFQEKIEASILALEVDALYFRWGLARIEGLTIDGEPPSVLAVLEKGPEDLTREIVRAIKQQCGLNDAERKN